MTVSQLLLRGVAVIAAAAIPLFGTAIDAVAQTPPPIYGLNGTIATEGSIDAVDVAAHTVVVKTVDGARHVFHVTKALLVHGSDKADELESLRPGVTVAVHYTVAGAEETAQEIDQLGAGGLNVGKGVVTRIDRGHKQITIRFENGVTETLELTDRAAASVGQDLDRAVRDRAVVMVYYTDDTGQKVVHFFKRAG